MPRPKYTRMEYLNMRDIINIPKHQGDRLKQIKEELKLTKMEEVVKILIQCYEACKAEDETPDDYKITNQ